MGPSTDLDAVAATGPSATGAGNRPVAAVSTIADKSYRRLTR